MIIALVVALTAHVCLYMNHFLAIGVTFVSTKVVKKLVQASGDKHKADIIAIGGYCLTVACFLTYLSAVVNTFTSKTVAEPNFIQDISSYLDGLKNLW